MQITHDVRVSPGAPPRDAGSGWSNPPGRPGPGSWLASVRAVLFRPVLDRSWDLMMYCCGASGLVTIGLCAVSPNCTELAVFVWLMVFASGPTSTFLPSASEPILMVFGKLYPPTFLAALGVVGIALVEWVNYRVFGSLVHANLLARMRTARWTTRIQHWFTMQPFATTVVGALTPIPFWIVRICGVLAEYPMRRFIVATAIGRFPRIWLFAFLGTALPVSGAAILLGGGVTVLGAAVVAASRKRARTVRAALDPVVVTPPGV